MPKSSTAKTVESSYGIAAIEAGLRVLEVIADHHQLTGSELASRVGMTRSKVFRVVRTLEALGYVTVDAQHRIALGRASYLLGRRAEQQYSVVQAASRAMDDLSRETRENVHLLIREGTVSLVIDLRQSPQPVRMFAEIGRRGPLHAGGSPKVLLAYAPTDIIEAVLASELTAYTAETVTDPELLRRTLQGIRERGHHTARNDLDEGTYSVAAPIYDDTGEVVASVSVAGPLMRWTETLGRELESKVVQASQLISQELGWRTVQEGLYPQRVQRRNS